MALAVQSSTLGTGTPGASRSNLIKVMVVDDSAVVRGLVSRWVGEESGMEIVARHINGAKAVEDVAKSQPDIIILDVEMPVMDGLDALPALLKNHPGVKVIMASTLTQRNAEISMKALSLGATDYIPKPDSNSGITTSSSFRRDLIARIRSLGGARQRRPVQAARPVTARAAPKPAMRASPIVRTPSPALRNTGAASAGGDYKLRPFSGVPPRILLVGSSTGGPQALVKLFTSIGPEIGKIPVLVTQHMPATFTAILAKNLGEVAKRPAGEARHRELIKPGTIYVAPGGYHMRLKSVAGGAQIALDQGAEVNFCRPAVDPMFESAARIYRSAILAAILTGMGQDGAEGAGLIAKAGGSVIVQDEETSVVWGMPGAAAAAGVCSAILPLAAIGPKINKLVK
ncbi:MAG: chemotaxis response regulator protein-glutamate methylesterase [Hyphomicrobiaceae bacterium]|nr:chemotaxis response regulator protein-glutamate methylesterase [Hyphomicrobiaceae bacterium]